MIEYFIGVGFKGELLAFRGLSARNPVAHDIGGICAFVSNIRFSMVNRASSLYRIEE